MLQDPYAAAGTVPDGLVTLRQFVGGLNAALSDQSYAGYDGYAANPTGRFYSVGPYGAAIEGQPVTVSSAGGVSLSPAMVLIGLAVAAFVLLQKA
jgi:hypothetical protein